MKKTKLRQRIKNSVNAFFENEPEISGETDLTSVNNSALIKGESAVRFEEKGDVLLKILKRTFLFLPGALYLFFGTLAVFSFDFLQSPFSILAVFLIGSFMTIFGIGNLKNPKHLVIPVSIIAVASLAFVFFSVFGDIKSSFLYDIYFFPLALVFAFLAKGLIDKTDDKKV